MAVGLASALRLADVVPVGLAVARSIKARRLAEGLQQDGPGFAGAVANLRTASTRRRPACAGPGYSAGIHGRMRSKHGS